jgi:DNA-binding Xre family transcriptional regulator
MVFEWNLRRVMAEHGHFQTTDLVPLLAEHGVQLSREQVYRLVTTQPQRLNMEVLVALCNIYGCTPSDLISLARAERRARETGEHGNAAVDVRPIRAAIRRPQ